MTVAVANVGLFQTFDFWRQRTNELASAMSTKVVSVSSNAAVGNAVVSGTLQSLILSTNAIGGVASVNANGTVVTATSNLNIVTDAVFSGNAFITTGLTVGNTTVNTFANSTAFNLGNTTVNAALTSTSFRVSNFVANTTNVVVSSTTVLTANVVSLVTTTTSTLNVSSTARFGNSTVRADITGTTPSINLADASTNAVVNTTTMMVGNSTANATQSSTQYSILNASANATYGIQSITFANSSVTFAMAMPNTTQFSGGNYYLNANGSWSIISSSVAGSNTQVIYNASGAYAGNNNLVFDYATVALRASFSANATAIPTIEALQTNTTSGSFANSVIQARVANATSYVSVSAGYGNGSPTGLIEFGNTLTSATIRTAGATTLTISTNGTVAAQVNTSQIFSFTQRPVVGSNTIVDFGHVASASQYWSNAATTVLAPTTVWAAAAEVNFGNTATTFTPDLSTFINARVTANANFTLAAPSNPKPGQSGYIMIIQDGTGSRVITLNSVYKFPNGASKVLSTAAGTVDVLYYTVANSTFIHCSLSKAVA